MFVAGFSLLTEPPSVGGNLTSEPTPRVQVPSHSVWWKEVFWTQWLEEMFISSNMRGDISLLNVYCGAAMIEVCLWSKKSAIRSVIRLRVDKVRTAGCFSVLPLLRIVGFHLTSLKFKQKKLSILPRFYFHDVLEQLKTNFIQILASKGFLVLW